MRLSYNWTKEFLHFDVGPAELAERLTMIGHEVEEIIDLGLIDNPIRAARITNVEPHPDAENLTVCSCDDGGGDLVRVVCGAPNAREGLVTMLARPGARLPGGKTMRRAKIRGVASEGMLLALDELGLGTDHSGIIEMDPDTPLGKGYDVLYEVAITPNRGDCLSVVGLARDAAAAWGQKVYPRPARFREAYESADMKLNLSVKATEECPRYTARVLTDVHVGPSPTWLQRKLLAMGLRPINNVVDATNFVLLERGQPLHAFDHDLLLENQIVVRMARAGESIRLLDQTLLELRESEDLVIADGQRPVALAGIMGGADTEVTAKTSDVVLEAAWFRPATIRRSAKHHRLSTDASYRFERGIDPRGLGPALDVAAGLLVQIAGAQVCKGIVDSRPSLPPDLTLLLRMDRAMRVLGAEIPPTRVADILTALGFEIIRGSRDNLVIQVPSHRNDVTREEDLYEEIARMYGYDNIAVSMPSVPASSDPIDAGLRLNRHLQDRLVGMGFDETVSLAFSSPEDLAALGISESQALHVLNPISRDLSILRPSQAPSLIRTLVYNQNRGNPDLRLFEIAKTFGMGDIATPCLERPTLAIAMMGRLGEPGWRGPSRTAEFFDLKGVIEQLAESVGLTGLEFRADGPGFLHPGRRAVIVTGRTELGWMGEMAPTTREQYGLRHRPQLATIYLDRLLPLARYAPTLHEIPRFPASERDLAIVIDRRTPASRIEKAIREAAGDLLEQLVLFDFYEGEQVPPGKRSLAYRLLYRHAERTLTDGEVDAVQARVVEMLANRLGAELRTT